MGAPPLVKTDIESGRAAIEAIKRERIPVRMAFWAYFSTAEEWRLVVVTSLVDKDGPRAAYAAVQRALSGEAILPLRRIVVVAPGDPVVRLVEEAARLKGGYTEGPLTISTTVTSTASGAVDIGYLYTKPL